ncbi:hypothetical protein FQA39_LY19000 [Lamprigera yunnana]|nr:hypothetical protein FQA39_LY19000 [Lamprigera yunnana]
MSRIRKDDHDPNFSAQELTAIAPEDLKQIVSRTSLSLNDKERMDIIDKTFKEVKECHNLVRYFANKNISVSVMRAKKEKNERQSVFWNSMGADEQKYWYSCPDGWMTQVIDLKQAGRTKVSPPRGDEKAMLRDPSRSHWVSDEVGPEKIDEAGDGSPLLTWSPCLQLYLDRQGYKMREDRLRTWFRDLLWKNVQACCAGPSIDQSILPYSARVSWAVKLLRYPFGSMRFQSTLTHGLRRYYKSAIHNPGIIGSADHAKAADREKGNNDVLFEEWETTHLSLAGLLMETFIKKDKE